jgi:platelet-activating factor acetylhydrolase IB subunit alpha
MAWGRALAGGDAAKINGSNPNDPTKEGERRVNVCATGSVDQTVKVWAP